MTMVEIRAIMLEVIKAMRLGISSERLTVAVMTDHCLPVEKELVLLKSGLGVATVQVGAMRRVHIASILMLLASFQSATTTVQKMFM